jgi:hypothetical protein
MTPMLVSIIALYVLLESICISGGLSHCRLAINYSSLISTYLPKSHHACVSFMQQTNKNDRATRGASACSARAIPQINNHPRKIGISAPLRQSSIVNLVPALPAWVLGWRFPQHTETVRGFLPYAKTKPYHPEKTRVALPCQ